MIKIESRVLGPVATNCYLIINKDNNESIIVDPADSPESIYDMVVRSASKPQAILLTHGHFDHIGAANEVREHYGIKIYASCDEEKLLASPARNLSNAYGMSLRVTADVLHNDGDILELAGLKIKAIHTPGHTAGGTCYYIESDKTLMSGDTLFAGSVGRTDYPTASSAAMMESLHDKLCKLPDDTDVYPGHGSSQRLDMKSRTIRLCDVMFASEKEATRSVIYFSRDINEQTPAKQAGKHDSAGLRVCEYKIANISAKRKQR